MTSQPPATVVRLREFLSYVPYMRLITRLQAGLENLGFWMSVMFDDDDDDERMYFNVA